MRGGMTLRAVAGFALGLALCGLLLRQVDVRGEDWLRLSRQLSAPWVLAVVVLTFVLWWSGARKWALWSAALHGAEGAEPEPRFFLRHFAWQNWWGQFVPTTLAVVLGRGWAMRRHVGWRGGAGGALYDQAMEFGLLCGLLPMAWLVLREQASAEVWGAAAVLGMAGAGGAMWLLRRFLPRGAGALALPLLAWSALRVVVMIARVVAGALALGMALDPVVIVAATPLVAFLALLPLTPGNLGLSEWGWVGALSLGGVDAGEAALFALGSRLLLLAVQSLVLAVNEGVFFAAKAGRG